MDRSAVLILACVVLAPTSLFCGNNGSVSKEDGGMYTINVVDKARDKKLGKLRDFIWNHWREHKHGTVIARQYSKEGVPATTNFTVEVDAEGLWIVRVMTTWPPNKGPQVGSDVSERRVYKLTRVTRGMSSSTISDDEIRPGESYRLIFYDKSGSENGGL